MFFPTSQIRAAIFGLACLLLCTGIGETKPSIKNDSTTKLVDRQVTIQSKESTSKEQELLTTQQLLQTLREFEKSHFPLPDTPEKVPPPDDESKIDSDQKIIPKEEKPDQPTVTSNSVGETGPPDIAPQGWLSKLKLPSLLIRWDPKLITYLEYYRSDPKGRAIMRHWLARQGRYKNLITKALRRYGLPKALLYVAMVESGYNPHVTSPVGAAGLWQFMVKTGADFDLKRDYWVDERRNPEKSTDSALRYLKELRSRLGTWELALAAYNAGFGAVVVAIQKYNTNDYWQLCKYEAGLPWSTTLYTPKILAAAIVGKNLEFFGYKDVKLEPEFTSEMVSVSFSMTIEQIAKASNTSVELITDLNPELRRGRTPPATEYWVRVPKGTSRSFYAELAKIRGDLPVYRQHIIRLGETERSIAQHYGISRNTLRKLNGIGNAKDFRPGTVVLIPGLARQTASRKDSSQSQEETVLVAVPANSPEQIAGRKRVFYQVALGDNLNEIAQHLHVTVEELIRWNSIDPQAKLISMMVLQAFVPQSFDESTVRLLGPDEVTLVEAGGKDFLNTHEERKGRKRLIYKVRKGDSVQSISRRFGLTEGSFMRINQISRNAKLTAGQQLVVYVDKKRLKPPEVKNTKKLPSKKTKRTSKEK